MLGKRKCFLYIFLLHFSEDKQEKNNKSKKLVFTIFPEQNKVKKKKNILMCEHSH